MTCDNEHTIGENGTHVRLVGMDTFAELSLVGRGAAKDAKILSRAKQNQSLSQETVERLAASNIPAEAHILTASYKLDNSTKTKQGENPMSGLETMLSETSQKLGKVESELTQATVTIEGLNGEIETLKASNAEKDEKITSLEAAQDSDVAELKATNEKLETQLTEASEIIFGDLKAAMVASGEKEEDLPQDLLTMLSLVKEKGLKLHQLFGSEEGTSNADKTDVNSKKNTDLRKAAFKLN
jgi:chromosome segregation ATPase